MEFVQLLLTGVQNWIGFFWMTTCEAAPFLLIGLLLAGILHIFIPIHWIQGILGVKGFFGAVRGAVVGFPLPLCSCGVLPTAIALRRKGASLSSTSAFLISTPETSLDALALTFALLPLAFFGLRPIAAIILSICVGMLVEKFAQPKARTFEEDLKEFSQMKLSNEVELTEKEICSVCGLMDTEGHSHSAWYKWKAVFQYAFGEFLRDIGKWVLIGLMAAAFVQVLIPDGLFQSPWWKGHPNLQILIAVLAGIPSYVCASATTPLVAALLLKGLDPGAALVFLLTGPAVNMASMFALRKEFGLRMVLVYYSSLISVCWIMGYAAHLAWPMLSASFPNWTNFPQPTEGGETHLLPAWIESLSAILLLILLIKGFFRRHDHVESGNHEHDHSGEHTHG